MEIDYRGSEANGDVLFKVNHVSNSIVIKDPDVVEGDDNYNYAKEFVEKFDEVLFSDYWLDEEKGYKKYIDINSFVDWYLINEISKNNDACFFASCFMNLNRETGILSMGPLWDFDLAFGNLSENGNDKPEGFWLKKTIPWYIQMFKDPEFVKLVKEHFDKFYSYRSYYTSLIKDKQLSLATSYHYNYRLWYDSTCEYSNAIYYFNQSCSSLETFMSTRWEWLKNEFDNM
jgi:hypothetical protein